MGRIDDILNQVDLFIKKYYKNQLIKGLLLFTSIFLVTYISVTGLEYVGRFSTSIRFILLATFICFNLFVLIQYIIIPITKLFSFGKRINRFQAAQIIGKFFPGINDKLLNTLQLNEVVALNKQNIELIQASIEQNSNNLSIFKFTRAIDYSENKKYLKVFLPILLLILLIGTLIPSFFREGTNRLVNYNEFFPVEAPFDFVLQSTNLQIEEGGSFTAQVKVLSKEGEGIPEKLFIESSAGTFIMNKTAKNEFSYTFQKISKSVNFSFLGNGFYSENYELNVFGKSSIGNFKAELLYPSYLGIKNKIVENAGDLVVPEGTTIEWSGITSHTEKLSFIFKDTAVDFTSAGFKYGRPFQHNTTFQIRLTNSTTQKIDSIQFQTQVIKDQYPTILIKEEQDSLKPLLMFFGGEASDDYGIKRVDFYYEIRNKGQIKENKTIQVPGISGTKSPFSMTFDINKLKLALEDMVNYYFVVYDNDGVNGSKSTKSSVFSYKVPSAQELNTKREQEKEQSVEELNRLLQESKAFKESMERFKKELSKTKNTGWKEQQQLEQLSNQKNNLEKRIEQLKEKLTNSFEEKNKLSPTEEELIEKQKLLEELLDDVMDEELEELLRQLEEMMELNDMDGLQEVMENMEMSTEDMEKQMDRTIEMLKKMDVEERIEDIEKMLNELSEEQNKVNEKLESKENVTQEQKEIKEQFNEIEKKIDELMNKNEELKRPMSLDDLQKERQETNEDLQQANDELENSKNKKASESQQSASEKMQQMAEKMQQMAAKSQQQEKGEDIESIKRLLESLMKLSFDQEFVMNEFDQTSTQSPSWTENGRKQREVMDNAKPVEDSLNALAERVPKIAKFISTELATLKRNFKEIPDDIDERKKRELLIKEQFNMTALNNLGLFLNESLEQMQNELQSMMAGEGSCDNPGGKGKGSGGDMESLKKMLQKQLQEMENGQNPNGKKEGNQEGENKKGTLPMSSKMAAQMAAQQNEIRRRLEEMKQQLNKQGKGEGEVLNELLKELEEQEQNLINKKWDNELINRQKEILTKLLESEKAIEERGFDDQRESNEGKEENFGNQIEFLEYNKRKEKQIELLRTLDPTYNRYYRDKAKDYFNRIY